MLLSRLGRTIEAIMRHSPRNSVRYEASVSDNGVSVAFEFLSGDEVVQQYYLESLEDVAKLIEYAWEVCDSTK